MNLSRNAKQTEFRLRSIARQGFQARRNGIYYDANPFDLGSHAWKAWSRGWIHAAHTNRGI